MLAGAGDPHIEESAFLVHTVRCIRERDGHQPLGQSCEEHGIPFQALGGVHRGQCHAVHDRRFLGLGPPFQLVRELLAGELFVFFLRSVAPKVPYLDRVTGKKMEPVTTGQIYWGAVPFVIIQCIMVALVIICGTALVHATPELIADFEAATSTAANR